MEENDIKIIIIKVSQLLDDPSGLGNGVTLSQLGYNANMCADLTNQLNIYIESKACNRKISQGAIAPGTTVGEVIGMVKKKLAECGL